MTKTFISKEVAEQGMSQLTEAQSIIDHMLNHPVLGKMFVMPDPPPPPLPWEVYGEGLCVMLPVEPALEVLEEICEMPCAMCGETGDTMPCITCNKLVCDDCGVGIRWCPEHAPED